MCKIHKFKAIALCLGLAFGAIQPAKAAAPKCPPGATDVGKATSITARLKATGATVPQGGVVPCDTIVINSKVGYGPEGSYAYVGNTASLSNMTTATFLADIAPAGFTSKGGSTVIDDPLHQCNGVSSEDLVSYEFLAGSLAPGTYVFRMTFSGTAFSGSDDNVGGFDEVTVTILSCDDGNPCTLDDCVASTLLEAGHCTHDARNCDDNNVCTLDTCDASDPNADPDTGCVHTARSCDDNNVCTLDSCDPANPNADPETGCVHTARSCDDNNVCTLDTCDPTNANADPATGCVHTARSCADTDPCTIDTCDPTNANADPVTGCVHTADPNCGKSGCTPGFYKNCTTQWPAGTSSTTTTLQDAYPCVDFDALGCSNIKNTTLLSTALQYKGGSTPCQKAEIMLRAAAAAYLNTLRLNYPIDTATLQAEVCAALAKPLNSTTIINEASRLDSFNNGGGPNGLGDCIDKNGNKIPCKAPAL